MPTPTASMRVARRYSYAAVLLFTGVGLAFPAAAGVLLGVPLAIGMVVLGVAHGACDQLVAPAQSLGSMTRGWRYWLRFLGAYLGLAGLVAVLWWAWPAAMVAIFFLLTVWHWGSADAPAPGAIPLGWWVAHSVVRGLLLFAIPAWWWPTETAEIVNGLLAFTGAAPVSPATFATASVSLCSLVGLGHLALWGYYASFHRDLLRPELLEVLVLSALLLALPPRLSVAVYFIFWHSLQHVLRLNTWLGYRHQQPTTADLLAQLQFFLRRAAPLLVVSCVALLALGYSLAHHLPDATAWFSLALIAASIVVTLPHALLVTLVMDAAQWQRPKPQVL